VHSVGVNANEMSRRKEPILKTLSAQRQDGGADGAVAPSLPRGNKPRGMKLNAWAAPVRQHGAARRCRSRQEHSAGVQGLGVASGPPRRLR
jgi:hypothetical protein